MGIPTRMAIAMSGLVFAGGAALVLGGATSANAESMVATPQHVTLAKSSCARRSGCRCQRSCGCDRHRGFHSSRNVNSHRQNIVIINRNSNISRSTSGFDRHRGFRGFDGFRNERFGGLDNDDWGEGDWND